MADREEEREEGRLVKHPMQAFMAGALAAMVDKMRDIAVIREIRKVNPDGFEVVLGSRCVIRVKLETVDWGLDESIALPESRPT